MRNLLSFIILVFTSIQLLTAQNTTVEGYIFEDGNRGYLNQVVVNVYTADDDQFVTTARSNKDGLFTLTLPQNKSYKLISNKDIFEETTTMFKTSSEPKTFLKIPMKREEGYIFEVTLAPRRENEDIVVDAITGALIEVYNNTKKEEVLVLENHATPDFKIQFKKGNHYTVMVRKEGYLVKRMEAFVNVDGCILCFEGVGEVKPGVTDNLTESMSMGTLLANVEMDPLYEGKIIELKNIYYDFGKATLTKEAKEELKKLANIMKDNPQINVELGSHTDVRGSGPDNRILSEKRAQSAVGYLTQELRVDADRIIAKGYGESNIKNKCKPGVTCTDEEHGENRRTEIKILKMEDDGTPMQSLASMIFEEEFERMVLEGGVEQVNYKETKDVESEPIQESAVEQVIEETEIKKEEVNKEIEKVEEVEEVIEEIPVVKEKVNTTFEAPKVAAKKSSMKPAKKKEMYQPEKEMKSSKQPYSPYRTSPSKESTEADAFSGYRIVVYFSNLPISGDNEIYDVFDDIITYETAEKNFLYMTGEFRKKEEAEMYNIEHVKDNYPNAYVVAFLKGKKINIE
ncbi:OmpA family protein [Portibacter lacus]|uniref:OmpA-like domain-containing protein n=1 Tax=Portibacter lacus TaxID=1099794 RepID=A0AA37WIN2_9BACT|nr:OmpA family protein [Portibacter lacus]GLR19995.1 hypothetical protein GCM10007940_46110 [Portibacter lacus]